MGRRHRRYFTVEEANAMLPLLEQKLHRLHRLYREAKDLYIEVKQIRSVGSYPDGTPLMAYDYKLARKAFEKVVAQINAAVTEINDMGCQLKHIELGLVDFPARIGDRTVLLCWRLGEPTVSHYHGRREGFAGRKPLQWP